MAVAATDRELAVIELNSETDFVARNTVFQELARGVVRNAGRLRSLNLTDNHVGDDIATAISASLGNTPARLSAFSHKALRGPITINIAYKFPGMEDNFR